MTGEIGRSWRHANHRWTSSPIVRERPSRRSPVDLLQQLGLDLLSLELTSEGSSGQCAPMGPSSPRWNFQRNDQRAWALVQVATQINLLTALSMVAEGQLDPGCSGYCSPVAATEPVGVMAVPRTSGIGHRHPLGVCRGEEVLRS